MFIRIGLDDTPIGLALVHTTLAIPFAVLITFSIFSGIPLELEEAAWTLGCNRLQAFQRVVLPLVLPGITASASKRRTKIVHQNDTTDRMRVFLSALKMLQDDQLKVAQKKLDELGK